MKLCPIRLGGTRTGEAKSNKNPLVPNLRKYTTKKEDVLATFSCFGLYKKVHISNVRMLLVLINLVVLGASFVSYFAWLDAKFNWQIGGDPRPDRNILKALEHLPSMPDDAQESILGVHSYLDQMLYLTAFNLFLYWIIYGLIISCRFGGSCDVCTLVISLPHTLMMIGWEIGVVIAILRVNLVLSDLPWENIQFTHRKHYTHLRYVEEFYRTWTPWLSAFYIATIPVQIFLVLLPFLVSNLPFQSDLEREHGSNQGERTGSAPGNPVVDLVEMKLRTITDYLQDRRSASLAGHAVTRQAGQAVTNQPVGRQVPEERLRRGTLSEESEYVGIDDLHDRPSCNVEVSSLYHCEMPHERLEKYNTQRLFARVRRVSERGQSAGKAVLETMNRVYHVRPVWNLLNEGLTYPLAPAEDTRSADLSAHSCETRSADFSVNSCESLDSDYIDMWSSNRSPPPPYSLYEHEVPDQIYSVIV